MLAVNLLSGVAPARSFDRCPRSITVHGQRWHISTDVDAAASLAGLEAELDSIFDLMTLRELGRIKTAPAPRGLALAGDMLYVTHFRGGAVSVIRRATLKVEKGITLSADHNLAQGIFADTANAGLPSYGTPAGLFGKWSLLGDLQLFTLDHDLPRVVPARSAGINAAHEK
jgi:hypothetical protein